jgi:hypothetical protein
VSFWCFSRGISFDFWVLQTNHDHAAEDDRVAEPSGGDRRTPNTFEDHPQSLNAAVLDELPRVDPSKDHRQLQSWKGSK